MEHRSEPNHVQLTGRVEDEARFSHTLYGEDFYSFHLVVARLSGIADVLPVTVGERALACMPQPADMLHVQGQLRSYNKQNAQGNRLMVTVFARELLQAPADAPCRNEIALTGFVCKPPVYRTTPFAREITDLLLAVNRSYHKSDYLPVIAWGRNARYASGLLVGDCLRVEGRVQSREYQKTLPDGSVVTKTAYEVSASMLEVEG